MVHTLRQTSGTTLTSRENWGTLFLILPALVFIASWFLIPLGQLFALSLSSEAGPLASYAELIGSSVFRRVFVNTMVLACIVTIICVVLAYPTAYLLTKLRGFWFSVALYCVLVPFWISVLVRRLADASTRAKWSNKQFPDVFGNHNLTDQYVVQQLFRISWHGSCLASICNIPDVFIDAARRQSSFAG